MNGDIEKLASLEENSTPTAAANPHNEWYLALSVASRALAGAVSELERLLACAPSSKQAKECKILIHSHAADIADLVSDL